MVDIKFYSKLYCSDNWFNFGNSFFNLYDCGYKND